MDIRRSSHNYNLRSLNSTNIEADTDTDTVVNSITHIRHPPRFGQYKSKTESKSTKILFQQLWNMAEETAKKTGEDLFTSFRILRYIQNPTYDMCLQVVKHGGCNIYYVNPRYRTSELCLAAVRNDGLSLKYIHNPTDEIKMEAVKQNGIAIRYIEDQTIELCIIAYHNTIRSLKYMNHSPDVKEFIIGCCKYNK
jgi:hypothetical protein